MNWISLLWRIVQLYRDLKRTLTTGAQNDNKSTAHPPITKKSVDAQVAHQKELYKKNHPRG